MVVEVETVDSSVWFVDWLMDYINNQQTTHWPSTEMQIASDEGVWWVEWDLLTFEGQNPDICVFFEQMPSHALEGQ